MMLGPIIGTVLYAWGGYIGMNVIFGSVFFFLTFFQKVFPSMIDLYTKV